MASVGCPLFFCFFVCVSVCWILPLGYVFLGFDPFMKFYSDQKKKEEAFVLEDDDLNDANSTPTNGDDALNEICKIIEHQKHQKGNSFSSRINFL